MFQVDAPGTYEYPAGVANPVITPGQGGTQAGADALMACVAAKVGEAPSVSGATGGIPEETEIRRTESGATVKRYTYGTPPSAAARQRDAGEMSAVPVAEAGYGQCPPGASSMYRGTLYCLGQ
ncbi:hypothetical protein [Salipiger abyssi]|uniref:hypothetical protein n=1 Tax=Salipiger abyssi TaxID=1250539 RepID=UPI001A8D9AC9|nr:hypothetical protein [Salipiger abyssi]MBN9889166.1 hypothetical protein [Salipiger abyssi]